MNLEKRDQAIREELASFLPTDAAKVVEVESDRFGTRIAVTEGPNGYNVYRAFGLGEEGGACSIDLHHVTANEVIGYLGRMLEQAG